jgi:hypothetical protein
MGTKRAVQLELSLFRADHTHGRRFTVTPVLQRHRLQRTLFKKLAYVRRFFPELDDRPLRIGLTRAASGMAVPGGDELWFNPSNISYHTIAHELVHLLQGHDGIPKSERSCDLFALARHWTLNDEQPCYLRTPKMLVDEAGKFSPANAKLVYDAAVEALRLRSEGTRNYIAFFEERLRQVASGMRAVRRKKETPAAGSSGA